jgi:hypothetical protein
VPVAEERGALPDQPYAWCVTLGQLSRHADCLARQARSPQGSGAGGHASGTAQQRVRALLPNQRRRTTSASSPGPTGARPPRAALPVKCLFSGSHASACALLSRPMGKLAGGPVKRARLGGKLRAAGPPASQPSRALVRVPL